jgi:hypothetical protein
MPRKPPISTRTAQDHIVNFADIFPAVLHACIFSRIKRGFRCINPHTDKIGRTHGHRICFATEHRRRILRQGNTTRNQKKSC